MRLFSRYVSSWTSLAREKRCLPRDRVSPLGQLWGGVNGQEEGSYPARHFDRAASDLRSLAWPGRRGHQRPGAHSTAGCSETPHRPKCRRLRTESCSQSKSCLRDREHCQWTGETVSAPCKCRHACAAPLSARPQAASRTHFLIMKHPSEM